MKINKLATYASAAVLATSAGSASAVVSVVTGTASGAAFSSYWTSLSHVSAYPSYILSNLTYDVTGTIDNVALLMELTFTNQVDVASNGALAEYTGTITIDFTQALPYTETQTDCTVLSGADVCGASPASGLPNNFDYYELGVQTKKLLSFTVADTADGITKWLEFNISPTGEIVPEVPVPGAAWLFGSALMGMAGIARKRKAA